MTTASKITILRICLIPIFMVFALMDAAVFAHAHMAALAVFVLASLTDALDGFVARNRNQITNFGKFMDPLADKLLVTSALLIFVQWGRLPAWVLMVILAREFAVTALRMMAATRGSVIAADLAGKLKTAVTIFAITIMLTTFHEIVLLRGVLGQDWTIDHLCIAAILGFTVYSGISYFVRNYKVLKEN